MIDIATKFYLFNLSYARRTDELEFIKSILARFNNEELTGITLLVNNNPYNLEFLLLVIFEKNDTEFDSWLGIHYPQKKMNYLFNYSIDDIIFNKLNKNRYSSYSFSTFEQVSNIVTDKPNDIFLFASANIVEQKWGKDESIFKYKIFLSHSSFDKPIVERIFQELQKEEIKVWFDKYEIDGGDSITDKLNEGLAKSDIGLLCYSRNFLNSKWAGDEMKYFFRNRMASGKKNFIILNIDLEISEFPPLLQDYKHIKVNTEGWMEDLIAVIRKMKIEQ
ncbi:TIR domain-containing protein [Chitinophaga sp. SYP-B3965]|uniref:toll/interleukin-1 receptor domain-containing protein n=1 Tax=Chitinophaga sp. SYP-B3965 TaxID=2663120 RepID=UPI0012995E98|nr:toll/interleukin-1 receptor domain-containing protein [Chitinophaga sp. SYP-B3965]MRG48991.1 TIR domain-containing protein [Chitinophaga sp. SYP-B3965]